MSIIGLRWYYFLNSVGDIFNFEMARNRAIPKPFHKNCNLRVSKQVSTIHTLAVIHNLSWGINQEPWEDKFSLSPSHWVFSTPPLLPLWLKPTLCSVSIFMIFIFMSINHLRRAHYNRPLHNPSIMVPCAQGFWCCSYRNPKTFILGFSTYLLQNWMINLQCRQACTTHCGNLQA